MECETEGSEQNEGFDEDIEDEFEEIEVQKRKNLEPGSSSGKKRKIKETDSNEDTNSEEQLEEGKGKSGIASKVSKNKRKKVDSTPSIPSDDEPLIKRMEKKGKNPLYQGKMDAKGHEETDYERDNVGGDEDDLTRNKGNDDQGFLKGIFGNLGLMKKEISSLQLQMQDIVREFDQLNKTTRGERTLGQHIDKLSEVIGNVEEVKNLMKHVPPPEAKNRALDQLITDFQKNIDGLDNRVVSMEKTIKKLANQNCSIMKTVVDNINTLLNKFEQVKGQGSKEVKDDQGPSKFTRANLKKIEGVKAKEMDDLKASAENMNILADQATDLLKTLQLVLCYIFAIFYSSLFLLLILPCTALGANAQFF